MAHRSFVARAACAAASTTRAATHACARRASSSPHASSSSTSSTGYGFIAATNRRRCHASRAVSTPSSSPRAATAAAAAAPPRSAYVHLPFCRSRCYYCDFAVSVVGSSARAADAPARAYAAALIREIRATASHAHAHAHAPLETIFFGGGTPSLVPADVIAEIIDALRDAFGLASACEVSAEMDPGTFDEEKLRAFMRAGVNRVSLGVQSFDDDVLKLAGRSHDAREVERAIEMMSTCAVPRWSADLISGLPGVNAGTWRTSLERVIAAGADHVSVYDLQVEAGTAFYRWYGEDATGKDAKEGLPSEDESADMFRDASATLGAAGYEHYEVSSYAKPGARCKHNQIYWQNASWYGFGMSATSHVNGERVARPRKMGEYYAYVDALERGENTGAISTGGDASDALFEHIMLRLRTSDGMNLDKVTERFGEQATREIDDAVAPFLGEYARYETSAEDGSRILRLNDPEGFLVSTEILSTLLSQMKSLASDDDGEDA